MVKRPHDRMTARLKKVTGDGKKEGESGRKGERVRRREEGRERSGINYSKICSLAGTS